MEARSYKSRTREEVMAWLQRARERKDAFQKRANEIFAEEDLDWDKIPSFGPFSDEEAIARIDKFEEELARGEVEWISDEEAREHLYRKYPWLK